MSDVIAPNRIAFRMIKNFSVVERFDDFGRGVISLSSFVYFVLLAVFGLYICMVLIGRRTGAAARKEQDVPTLLLPSPVAAGDRNRSQLASSATMTWYDATSPTEKSVRSRIPHGP